MFFALELESLSYTSNSFLNTSKKPYHDHVIETQRDIKLYFCAAIKADNALQRINRGNCEMEHLEHTRISENTNTFCMKDGADLLIMGKAGISKPG